MNKIYIIGASFRQAKFALEKMFNNINDVNLRITRSVDRVTVKYYDMEYIAIPIGDGSRIREIRDNQSTYLFVEPLSIPRDVIENISKGFSLEG